MTFNIFISFSPAMCSMFDPGLTIRSVVKVSRIKSEIVAAIVGASANIVVVGIAQRAGSPVSFWDFTKRGAVVALVSAVISVAYLWVRYSLLA